MAEKLIPVRSEAEIVVGGIYVLKDCRYCGGDHRSMMTARKEGTVAVDAG